MFSVHPCLMPGLPGRRRSARCLRRACNDTLCASLHPQTPCPPCTHAGGPERAPPAAPRRPLLCCDAQRAALPSTYGEAVVTTPSVCPSFSLDTGSLASASQGGRGLPVIGQGGTSMLLQCMDRGPAIHYSSSGPPSHPPPAGAPALGLGPLLRLRMCTRHDFVGPWCFGGCCGASHSKIKNETPTRTILLANKSPSSPLIAPVQKRRNHLLQALIAPKHHDG
jgi:hypothetical protein